VKKRTANLPARDKQNCPRLIFHLPPRLSAFYNPEVPNGVRGVGVTKRILIGFLKYAFGIGLLIIVVAWNWQRKSPDGRDVGLAVALTRPIQFIPFFLALLVCSVSVLMTFVRWFVLVRAQDLPFTILDALRLGLIGFYFSTFLPGAVGGDIVKAACLAREQSRRAVAVATVLLDRAIGLCGLFWLVAIVGGVFWLTGDLTRMAVQAEILATIVFAAWIAVLGSLTFWFLLGFFSADRSERIAVGIERLPKVGHALAEFWRAVRMYRNRGGYIALAMLLSLIGHVGFVLVFYWSAATLTPFDQLPSLASHFLFVPVGMTIQAGFPTPNGMGGGELAFGWLYSQANFPFDLGLLGALIERFIILILGMAGFLVYLQMRPTLQRAAVSG